MPEELGKLQSGSDIRGIAIQYGNKKVTLEREMISLIAEGYIEYIKEKLDKKPEKMKISVGLDSRLTGRKLQCAFIEKLLEAGVEVYDFGIATTPSMFMSTIFEKYSCDAAVMFTASHLPYYYNGIKFFTKDGAFEKEDISEIIKRAEKYILENPDKKTKKGKINRTSILRDYSQFLADKVREGVNSKKNYEKPLEGMHIIVDAANGSGGFFAEKVLEALGADTSGSIFLNPDGSFPNHTPNPEDTEAMDFLKKAVLESKADFGISFDTDVDRASCVDKFGKEISRNRLMALVSEIILEEYPGSTIVTDSLTSTGLAKFISDKGGKHFRYKRGYKNVINKAVELNNSGENCYVAMETSGHVAFKENNFLDDGAYLMAKILVKLAELHEEGKEIGDLLENYEESLETQEVRLNLISTEPAQKYTKILIKDLEKYIRKKENWFQAEENYEGIRVNCVCEGGNVWFLLRASLHEQIISITAESDFKGGTELVLNELLEFLKNYEEIDFSEYK